MTVLRNVYVTDATTGATAEVETNGEMSVHDHTADSPIIIVPFHTVTNTTTLAAAPTVQEDYSFDVTVTTGFVAGAYITIWNTAGNRWYQGHQVGAVATNTVTVDTPIDFEYQIGDQVSGGSSDMAVKGSVTPVHYHIRYPDPGLTIVGDITRIILVMECGGACSWAEFGDQTALTNGLILRKSTASTLHNILNAKSNKELANVMYDLDILLAAGPAAVDAVKGRMTFSGLSKMGTVVRLDSGEDLEFIVQDNISGLTTFKVFAEGYVSTHG